MAEKHAKTDESDTEMDICTEAGGEAADLRRTQDTRRGYMTNMYLSDSDKEAIVNYEGPHYGKHMQSKSGQAPKEMKELQNWIQDKSQTAGTSASTASTDMDSMETSL